MQTLTFLHQTSAEVLDNQIKPNTEKSYSITASETSPSKSPPRSAVHKMISKSPPRPSGSDQTPELFKKSDASAKVLSVHSDPFNSEEKPPTALSGKNQSISGKEQPTTASTGLEEDVQQLSREPGETVDGKDKVPIVSDTCSHHSSKKSALGSQKSSNRSIDSTNYYRQEAFETYQLKVVQLCRDIGWGEPSEVERMKGGSFNRIIGLKFQDRDCVLRTRRPVPPAVAADEVQSISEIKDQVAILHFTSEYLPVPSIMAFDSDSSNALGASYVIQERLPGTDLDKIYENLPLNEKLQVATAVAELILKIESVKCNAPGRLTANASMPGASTRPLDCAKTIETGGFRLKRNFRNPATPQMKTQSLGSFLEKLFESRINSLPAEEDFMKYDLMTLKGMVSQMKSAGLLRTTDVENVLWHWDLAARNIMVMQTVLGIELEPITSLPHGQQTGSLDSDQSRHKFESTVDGPSTETATDNGRADFKSYKAICGESLERKTSRWYVTGIIDWDGAMSVPRVLTREPPSWLWGDDDEPTWAWYAAREAPLPRVLSSDELLIKAHFDQIMQLASPSYMNDAYHRGPWLRRLAHHAFYGWEDQPDYRFSENLMKEWDQYYELVSPSYDDETDEDCNSAKESDGSGGSGIISGSGSENGSDVGAMDEETDENEGKEPVTYK